jgi:hypothetical protein
MRLVVVILLLCGLTLFAPIVCDRANSSPVQVSGATPDFTSWHQCGPILASGYTVRAYWKKSETPLGALVGLGWYRNGTSQIPDFVAIVQVKAQTSPRVSVEPTVRLFQGPLDPSVTADPPAHLNEQGLLWDPASPFGQAFAAWAQQLGGDPHPPAYRIQAGNQRSSILIDPYGISYVVAVVGPSGRILGISEGVLC